MTRPARHVVIVAMLFASLQPAPAGAQPATQEAEAERLYVEARRMLEEGEVAGALDVLVRSLALQPSPNTELLVAHALRRLSRKPEAMAAYARVVERAGEKVASGETRYAATLDEAGRWIARLRVELAEIEIVASGAPEGSTIAIDGAAIPSVRQGADLVVSTWREPGALAARVIAPDGRSASRDVTAPASNKTVVRLDLTVPTPVVLPPPAPSRPHFVPMPPRPTPDRRRGPPPASWIVGGVGVAGLGVFGVFGAMSLSNASEADACKPRCSPALTNEGDRNQTIANVGLAVGATGLAVAAVLWLVDRP